jgi:hypothetical protein
MSGALRSRQSRAFELLKFAQTANKLDAIVFNGTRSMETNMRKAVLTVLGMALIGALTIQAATAAARQTRKPARVSAPASQQPRERHPPSAPASAPPATHTRSCDVIWCYED